MVEFWNETLTNASWEKLQEISKRHKFVLIGGWAIFLWSGMHKSKDIDIVVDYGELLKMKGEYALAKNERLCKYEAKLEKFDIDIYLPAYSRLSVPCEEILENARMVQGISVCEPEILLVLKQGAFVEREGSTKGRKDLIDIVSLLAKSGLSLEKYAKCAKRYGHAEYVKELAREIARFDGKDLQYVGMNVVQFAKWKKEIAEKLRGI